MAVAAFAALALVTLDAITYSAWWRDGFTINAIFRMFIIAMFVFPGAVLAWRLREGMSLKSWAAIASRYWLTAGAVVLFCVQSGLYRYLSNSTNWNRIQETIFNGALCLPFGMFFIFWLTHEKRLKTTYPIRGVRRRINGRSSVEIPFISKMGMKDTPTRAFSANRFRVKRNVSPQLFLHGRRLN